MSEKPAKSDKLRESLLKRLKKLLEISNRNIEKYGKMKNDFSKAHIAEVLGIRTQNLAKLQKYIYSGQGQWILNNRWLESKETAIKQLELESKS